MLAIHSFVPKPACELPVALLGTNLRSLGREGQVGPTQGSTHGLSVAAASPLNPRAALLVPMSFLVGFSFFFFPMSFDESLFKMPKCLLQFSGNNGTILSGAEYVLLRPPGESHFPRLESGDRGSPSVGRGEHSAGEWVRLWCFSVARGRCDEREAGHNDGFCRWCRSKGTCRSDVSTESRTVSPQRYRLDS